MKKQIRANFFYLQPILLIFLICSAGSVWAETETVTAFIKVNLDMYIAGHIPFAVGLDGILAAGMNEIAHIEELDFEFLEFNRTRTLGHAEWFKYILQIASEQIVPLADLPVDELEERYQADIDQKACNPIQFLKVY